AVYVVELEVETIINKMIEGRLRWLRYVRKRPQATLVTRVEALVVDRLRRREIPAATCNTPPYSDHNIVRFARRLMTLFLWPSCETSRISSGYNRCGICLGVTIIPVRDSSSSMSEYGCSSLAFDRGKKKVEDEIGSLEIRLTYTGKSKVSCGRSRRSQIYLGATLPIKGPP
nr:hypothetical protein [Tanacetum cinerariifolium]